VVYGHTPVPEAAWVNNTICIDTGCVFGGRLTALRYPERELVSVPAGTTYYQPARPLTAPPPSAGPSSAGPASDGLLDVADVLGRRGITTGLRGRVTVPEQNAAAALEVMSRFAADPRWLIYLPPTMPPVPASTRPGLLEHPADALAAYRRAGVAQVICEEKHMGSRAVVIACRTPEAAADWFGSERSGIVYTRTGRRFFTDARLEETLLGRVTAALAETGLWAELGDWAALDCEIMPWSLKAEDLVRGQYAAVGAAAVAGLTAAGEACEEALRRGADVAALRDRTRERLAAARSYTAAYRHYVWPVRSLADVRLAPFQVLAGSAGTFFSRDHRWHLNAAERLAAADPLIVPTRHIVADLGDEESGAAVTAWWERLTGAGGEGMVAKPLAPVTRLRHGVAQHGMKCRGPEYLRIIYGPEYAIPANLGRLAGRNLSRKQSLAAGEFALGAEALDRFTRREPLFRVHECVFGVLALESEPVDPRL
jgi:protein phosphatase